MVILAKWIFLQKQESGINKNKPFGGAEGSRGSSPSVKGGPGRPANPGGPVDANKHLQNRDQPQSLGEMLRNVDSVAAERLEPESLFMIDLIEI